MEGWVLTNVVRQVDGPYLPGGCWMTVTEGCSCQDTKYRVSGWTDTAWVYSVVMCPMALSELATRNGDCIDNNRLEASYSGGILVSEDKELYLLER